MSEVAFLVGETVAEIRDDNRLVFVSGDKPEPSLYADVGECLVTDAVGQPQSLVSLIGRKVAEATTSDDVLALEFTDGFRLECEPNANYEAWQVVGGDPHYLVVCLPGGQLAVWDDRDRL